MNDSDQRVADLERALADAIAYLERMPSVPVTREKAAALQAVLARTAARSPDRARVAEHITPPGIPMMRAELIGDELILSTRTPRLTEAKLLSLLRRPEGYVMRLKQLGPGNALTEYERTRREAIPDARS